MPPTGENPTPKSKMDLTLGQVLIPSLDSGENQYLAVKVALSMSEKIVKHLRGCTQCPMTNVLCVATGWGSNCQALNLEHGYIGDEHYISALLLYFYTQTHTHLYTHTQSTYSMSIIVSKLSISGILSMMLVIRW